MLDIVQHALQDKGFSCARIDGKRSLEERSAALRRFNYDPSCTVMLATIGSCGEGYDKLGFDFLIQLWLTYDISNLSA